eukprot:829925-Pyramimonas_sp.AAC.1
MTEGTESTRCNRRVLHLLSSSVSPPVERAEATASGPEQALSGLAAQGQRTPTCVAAPPSGAGSGR